MGCSIPLAGTTCQFTPNPATPAAGGTKVALTVSVPVTASYRTFGRPERFAFSLCAMRGREWLGLTILFVAAIFILRSNFAKRRRVMAAACCVGVMVLLNMMAACGGSGGGGANQGKTYVVTITGASGGYQHLTSVQLVVD